MLLLDIGMGSNDVSKSLSNSIFLGSSWIELRVNDDKTQEPVLFPVAPTPYLTSKGKTLILSLSTDIWLIETKSEEIKGPKTEGAMAEEIDLSKSRDPDFVFDEHVQKMLNQIHNEKKSVS